MHWSRLFVTIGTVTFYPINCYLLFPSGDHVAIMNVQVEVDASNVGIDGERI